MNPKAVWPKQVRLEYREVSAAGPYYNRWEKYVCAKLGIDPGTGYDFTPEPQYCTYKDGHWWSRDTKDRCWYIVLPKGMVTDSPHVMCKCGNTAFTLQYGEYVLFAICIKCGAKSLVYDG